MRFWPQTPRFPLIIDLGVRLGAVEDVSDCDRLLAPQKISVTEEVLDVIDGNAEGFALYPDMGIISPFAGKTRWTKQEIVSLYNKRRPEGLPEYAPTSLSNKKAGAVVAEVVSLLRGGPTSRSNRSRAKTRAPV